MNEQPKWIAHYGVRGQRWGVRRMLRTASANRAKARAQREKLRAADRKVKYDARNQRKRDKYLAKHLSGLSTAELQKFTARQNALASARDAYSRANPQPKNTKNGNTFKKKLIDAATDIAINEGKNYVKHYLIKQMGVDKNLVNSGAAIIDAMAKGRKEEQRKQKNNQKGGNNGN